LMEVIGNSWENPDLLEEFIKEMVSILVRTPSS
jgi:hypothetical protein